MAPQFTTHLKRQAVPVWQHIFHDPFLQEVRDGSLPMEKFRYFLTQDYHYMEAFGRAVAIALTKATDRSTMELLARRLVTPLERPLHRRLFDLAGMEIEDVERAKPSPTNTAYMNHVLATASTGDVGQIAAALLPCPWVYHELGNHLPATGHPIYDTWSAFYRDGGMYESVRTWRQLVDQWAEHGSAPYRKLMESAFLTSSRYEYLFWKMAYRMEEWPI